MSTTSPQRPTTPKKEINIQNEIKDHWCKHVYECVVCVGQNGKLNIQIAGGSDNGEFTYFTNVMQDHINYLEGRIENEDIILEIQGQKVAGFTQKDVIAWLSHCTRSGNTVNFIATRAGYLHKELRKYLQSRFQKLTPDHDLQGAIRDNLYLRTVPCTTRPPREGEINGTDYTFLTVDQFMALERSGKLLESGIYEGFFYGLPKPDPNSDLPELLCVSLGERSALPGHHYGTPQPDSGATPPPSDNLAPRHRNLSGLEAMQHHLPNSGGLKRLEEEDQWEKAYTETGEPYYINHATGTSQWAEPWLPPTSGLTEELPEGWEKIDDPQYGTYYIDHINKKTQYENPLIQVLDPAAKPREGCPPNIEEGVDWHRQNGHSPHISKDHPPPSVSGGSHQPAPNKLPYIFTPHPQELQGEMVHTVLVKSSRGFGFTIIGGENPAGQPEFLQIKSVVGGGPAWADGRLATGDVLVYVGETCVLGSSHADVVRLFQAIPPGQAATLTVCRGYPLPFDLDDPNNQVVTTSAIHDSEARYLGLNIKKGPNGFGFTIADSGHGQKVKKILDPSHCRQLQEGDVLVDIDGRNVRDMAHDDIVQLLKECSVGDSASVTVLRGPQRPASLSSSTAGGPPAEFYPGPGDYTDMLVTLVRQENGFGFRIIGGTEEGSQVSIGNIVAGGSASVEGTLRSGDEILSIDNQCVINSSHHFAVQLMSNAAQNGRVVLRVRRHFHSGDSGYTSKSNDSLYPYDITVHREESEGFGFVIISSVNKAGSTIGRIIEGSPAERCGQLQVGDRILAVNGTSILNMPHGDIVNLIKESGLSATLTIGSPSNPIGVAPPGTGNGTDTASIHSEDDYIPVELKRGPRGFGFSIRGGIDVNDTPLCVLRMADDGPAAVDGRLRIGDRLVEINGMSTEGLTHSQAIDAIRRGNNIVRLLVQRPRQMAS